MSTPSPVTAPSIDSTARAHRWLILAVTALALLVIGLDTTVLNVALPTLSQDLGASTSQLQWFADAYLLVLASLLLPAGMLGDRLGRRPLMIGALAVFATGSAWCAYAASPDSLIAARAFMGLGAAMLIPLTFSLLVLLFDPDERPKALAVLGVSTMIGMPLGPIVGGELLRRFWWGSVFVVNVPVACLALVASWWLLPRETLPPRPRIDVVGVVLSASGLVGLTYGLIEGPTSGWTSPVVLGSTIGGALVLGGFLGWERRVRRDDRTEPLLDDALLRVPAFRWGAFAASVASLVGFVALFTTPLYLHGILGTDALQTGIRLLPLIGGILVGFPLAVRLVPVVGPRLPMAAGFGLLGVGAALGARTSVTSGEGRLALWLTVFGAGFGIVLITGQNLAVDTLSPERSASGGALVQVLRQLSSVLGIAALGSVLNAVYRSRVDVAQLPAEVVAPVRGSLTGAIAVADRLGDRALAASAREAFVAGLRVELWLTLGLAVAGLVLALWTLPDPRRADGSEGGPAVPERAGSSHTPESRV